jgi:hypothetical protein
MPPDSGSKTAATETGLFSCGKIIPQLRYLSNKMAAEIKTAAAPMMIQKTVRNICWSDGAA